ncbi:MAG: WD40 repeat domain-containing protein [Bacillota bacterium]|jgi:WD40 repeat protein
MRRFFCLALVILAAAAVCACQPLVPGSPDGSSQPPGPQQPVKQGLLQLSATPKPGTAICSADGRLLAMESDQGLLLVQNRDGCLQEVEITLGQTPVLDMALSSDGRWLAIASADRLQVLSTEDGSVVSTIHWPHPISQATLQVSQEGLNIACLGDDCLYLFHGPLLNLRWCTKLVVRPAAQSLLMSNNGLTLIVVGDGFTVFSPDASSPLWKKELDGEIKAVALSEDGVYLAIELEQGPTGGQLLLFERWSSEPTWEFEHQAGATDLKFSPDGAWLALSTDQFYLFSCRQAQPVMQLQQAGATALNNGQVLLIAEESLYFFSAEKPEVVVWQLPLHEASEFTYVYSQREWLYAISADGLVSLVRLPVI